MASSRSRSERRIAFLVAAFALLTVVRAGAEDVLGALTGYRLTTWNHIGGLPRGSIYAISQDADGYLWLGTQAGVVRFDGTRFIPWHSQAGAAFDGGTVRLLRVARDGAIWVGVEETSEATHISRLAGGQVLRFDTHDGIPVGRYTALAEDANGTIWIGGDRGLFSWDGHHWLAHAGPRDPRGRVTALLDDETGLTVVAATGVYRRARGDHEFALLAADERSAAPDVGAAFPDASAVATTSDGDTIVSDIVFGYRVADGSHGAHASKERGRGYRLMRDRRGDMWVATIGQGLWRVRRDSTGEPLVEKASELTGLPSDSMLALFEDRDGNIWVGTSEGLCRLTKLMIDQVRGFGPVRSVAASPSGALWVGASDELIQLGSGGSNEPQTRIHLGARRLQALHVDAHGTVWLATNEAVSRIQGDRLVTVPGFKGLRQVTWLTTGPDGDVWCYDLTRGFFHATSAGIEPRTIPADVARSPLTAGFVDHDNRLWAAFENGRVAVITATSARVLEPRDLFSGVYRAVYQDHTNAIWLGGSGGLTRVVGDRVVTVQTETSFRGEITSIVESAPGVLWLGTANGIVRLERAEFERASSTPNQLLRHNAYSRADGLGGFPLALYGNGGRVARSLDGRLWFVTGSGLTVVDPRLLPVARAYPVRIESVVTGTSRIAATDGLRLPPKTTNVEIDYTTLNLSPSQNTQYRYQLEGIDRTWVNAGDRQEAFYTNLSPGNYRFSVIAGEDDNGWNATPAVFAFVIEPTFYQTRMFLVLVLGVAVALLAALWEWRERHLRQAFSLVISERLRLSRELHDTLLQGLVGVALQLEAIASSVSTATPALSERLSGLRERTEGYVREAREAISRLRTAPPVTADLVTSLRNEASRVTAASPLNVTVTVQGTPVHCPDGVEEQLRMIVREAFTNIVRHAQAANAQLLVKYSRKDLNVTVSDDGRGFDAANGHQDGHFGLIGMNERARSIDAALAVASAPRSGTSITVTVRL